MPWRELARWLGWPPVHPVVPLGGGDDGLVADPLRIRRMLGELLQPGRTVALHAPRGPQCVGRFQTLGVHELVLEVDAPGLSLQPEDARVFNLTASCSDGMLMFSLRRIDSADPVTLRAPWPDHVLLVQSRRHFRVRALAGTQQRAWLELPGRKTRLALHDLSEEGMGFDLPSMDWLPSIDGGHCALALDDSVLPVPCWSMVHHRLLTQRGAWRIGARMFGLAAQDQCRLRRWLTAAQAAAVPTAQTQDAPATRSKR